MNLPIAEAFVSVQGEGRWTGTSMYFIRFAGCCVGKGPFPHTCTLWNDREFECDTDYAKYGELDTTKIISIMQSHHIKRACFTGGEPLMHDLDELVCELDAAGYMIHIETSGTVAIPSYLWNPRHWVTLSPKKGYRDEYLRRADEIKLLVNPWTTLEELNPFIYNEFMWRPGGVYIQPVNFRDHLDEGSLQRCLQFLKAVPRLQLSIQMHKVIGVR